MYVRKSRRKYKGKVYTNTLLVESVRTPKGPRQRTICSLGDLRPRPRGEWLKLAHKVEDALVGQADWLEPDEDPEVVELVGRIQARREQDQAQAEEEARPGADDLVEVHTDQVETEQHREAGPVHVGVQYWRRLGLDEILLRAGLSERSRLLTCLMVLNRLIKPGSEHAMPHWARRTAVDDLLEVDVQELAEDVLYRNMDRLHPGRAMIEAELSQRETTLFNLDQSLLLYDVTSTYFEGQALANSKARLGYSRDKRPDCKQVVVGLALNRDGFPQAHEVFEGNIQDRATVARMLDLLDERVGLEAGQTVVVDRGMAFEENITEIRSRGLHYVVASRKTERDAWLAEFEDLDGFTEVLRPVSANNRWQKKSSVGVKMAQRGGETFVLCVSSARSAKDRAIREKQETRLLADLSKLARRVERGRLVKPQKVGEAIGRLKERYPRVARYYRMHHDAEARRFTYEVDAERRGVAEQLDGSYLLRTDRKDLSGEEAWRFYSLLSRAENAFRAMKSPLAERPIYHQLEHRVETHIFLCVLAYHLLVAIEKTLQDNGVYTSWATVRDALATHQICTVVLPTSDGSVLRIRKGGTPEPEHLELYRLLGVPSQVMRPRKTWTNPPRQPPRSAKPTTGSAGLAPARAGPM